MIQFPLRRFGLRLLRAGAAVLALGFCLTLYRIVAEAGAARPAAEPYILVLGAGVHADGSLSQILQSRLRTCLRLAHRYPQAQLLLSGGRGGAEPQTEAAAMRDYLLGHGLSPARLLLEPASHNTRENLQFSHDLLRRRGVTDPPRVLLVTSDFHLYRARRLALANGFSLTEAAAPTPATVYLFYAFREYVALMEQTLYFR